MACLEKHKQPITPGLDMFYTQYNLLSRLKMLTALHKLKHLQSQKSGTKV